MILPLPDRAGLRARLETAAAPLWETALFHAAWPGESQADWSPLELFQRHFCLFAALYQLSDEYLAAGSYLHVHFMRTRLLPLPPPDRCRHYEAEPGAFCGHVLPCPSHPVGTLPAPADSRGFYRDPANIAWMDEEKAERVVGGAWRLLADWPKAEAAWRTLGLSPGTGIVEVRRRFRDLARRHHPDTAQAREGPPHLPEEPAAPSSAGGQAMAEFTEIRAAYELLRNLLAD